MDASQLGEAAVVVSMAVVVGRFILRPIGGAGDMMAGLFVPPDRSLGWPRGVQESDEPWGWRSGRTEPEVVGGPDDDLDGGSGDDAEAEDGILGRSGSLVVPIGRVTPVRLGLRPH
jgi:hypothetical protein